MQSNERRRQNIALWKLIESCVFVWDGFDSGLDCGLAGGFEEILVFRKKLEDFSENYKPIGEYNEEQYSKLIDFLKNMREKSFLKEEILLINVRSKFTSVI